MKTEASLDMQTEAEIFSDNLKRNRRDLYFVIKEWQEMKSFVVLKPVDEYTALEKKIVVVF